MFIRLRSGNGNTVNILEHRGKFINSERSLAFGKYGRDMLAVVRSYLQQGIIYFSFFFDTANILGEF